MYHTFFVLQNQKYNIYLGKQVICFRDQNCFNKSALFCGEQLIQMSAQVYPPFIELCKNELR